MPPSHHYLSLLCAITAGLSLQGAEQAAVQQRPDTPPNVTIVPRARPGEPAGAPLPKSNIRVDSTLVLIPVTVTDPMNRFVTGLEKENFKLLEDKVEQEVSQFSSEDAPLSVGVVFDCSGSM